MKDFRAFIDELKDRIVLGHNKSAFNSFEFVVQTVELLEDETLVKLTAEIEWNSDLSSSQRLFMFMFDLEGRLKWQDWRDL